MNPAAAKERISRIQQLTEVPPPHRQGRNSERPRRFLTPTDSGALTYFDIQHFGSPRLGARLTF